MYIFESNLLFNHAKILQFLHTVNKIGEKKNKRKNKCKINKIKGYKQ